MVNPTNSIENSPERVVEFPGLVPRLRFCRCSHPSRTGFCKVTKEFSSPGGRGRSKNSHGLWKNRSRGPFHLCDLQLECGQAQAGTHAPPSGASHRDTGGRAGVYWTRRGQRSEL